ncbi:metallophosphoesterase [Corynebacterium heidelbergense]|uniref:Phosphoprotein phosphatase n=1 Tax=Corynebacterium heidelbergense TaxID=2055947 RepID=A0A364VDH8_9CORY|nr:metallophosphoesterase [Corynebacterium heidelbergense]RAV34668.1 phosphoprotein phosphatase [Corynebacterium heidelbergense]WCZ36240.1 Calcineurin-like phosphoesterase superfamily domain protein [Corynebacterium heidelbergense]
MTTWITADLHLGHPFVAKLRGYPDVLQHDRIIVDNLRAALRPGDVLWMLGDISSGWGPQEERALDVLDATFRALRETPAGFSVHLIAGNHDTCNPLHPESHLRQRRFLDVFDSVQTFQMVEWGGEQVYLSHFPRPGYEHDNMESRYDELRLDVPLLVHGHLHSSRPVTGHGMVDVGVEAWDLHPVPAKVVQQTLFTQSL